MNNSKFKVKFTLKQHTPIIHFQSDQSGATLRATELKPKFDKFLIENVFQKNKFLYENYLINIDKVAFDYKVKIIPLSEIKFPIINLPKMKNGIQEKDKQGKLKWFSYPNFFANMGDDTGATHKKFSLTTTIQITFNSLNSNLCKIIEKWFPAFLLHENFGTRQSKGFGSFSLDTSDKRYQKNVPSNLLKKSLSFFVEENDYSKVFNSIELLYKTLRGGINQLDRDQNHEYYFKSAMFLYAKENNIIWDKRAIKEKFISKNTLGNEIKKYNSPDILTINESDKIKHFIMRDLLGLSTSQQWGKTFELTKSSNDNISRMKSPLLFKPVKENNGFRVYIILNPIPQEIFGKKFKITTNRHSEELELSFPPIEKAINMHKLLQFVIKINLNVHVDNKFHSFKKYHNVLQDIYAQLLESFIQIIKEQKAQK